jgi:hypothetical protein
MQHGEAEASAPHHAAAHADPGENHAPTSDISKTGKDAALRA